LTQDELDDRITPPEMPTINYLKQTHSRVRSASNVVVLGLGVVQVVLVLHEVGGATELLNDLMLVSIEISSPRFRA
jgi:hypothetical protein